MYRPGKDRYWPSKDAIRFGLTKKQVIGDVLERYEAYLAFLTFSSETNTASVLTPSMQSTETPSEVPPDAGLGEGPSKA